MEMIPRGVWMKRITTLLSRHALGASNLPRFAELYNVDGWSASTALRKSNGSADDQIGRALGVSLCLAGKTDWLCSSWTHRPGSR